MASSGGNEDRKGILMCDVDRFMKFYFDDRNYVVWYGYNKCRVRIAHYQYISPISYPMGRALYIIVGTEQEMTHCGELLHLLESRNGCRSLVKFENYNEMKSGFASLTDRYYVTGSNCLILIMPPTETHKCAEIKDKSVSIAKHLLDMFKDHTINILIYPTIAVEDHHAIDYDLIKDFDEVVLKRNNTILMDQAFTNTALREFHFNVEGKGLMSRLLGIKFVEPDDLSMYSIRQVYHDKCITDISAKPSVVLSKRELERREFVNNVLDRVDGTLKDATLTDSVKVSSLQGYFDRYSGALKSVTSELDDLKEKMAKNQAELAIMEHSSAIDKRKTQEYRESQKRIIEASRGTRTDNDNLKTRVEKYERDIVLLEESVRSSKETLVTVGKNNRRLEDELEVMKARMLEKLTWQKDGDINERIAVVTEKLKKTEKDRLKLDDAYRALYDEKTALEVSLQEEKNKNAQMGVKVSDDKDDMERFTAEIRELENQKRDLGTRNGKLKFKIDDLTTQLDKEQKACKDYKTAVDEKAAEIQWFIQSRAEDASKLQKEKEAVAVQKKYVEELNGKSVQNVAYIKQLETNNGRFHFENDKLTREKAQVSQENTQLSQEKAQLIQEKAQLAQEKAQLAQEKVLLLQEKAQLVKNNRQLNATNQELLREKGQVPQDRVKLEEDNGKLRQTNQQLVNEKAQYEQEKAQLEQEKAQLEQEKTQMEQGIMQLEQEKTQLITVNQQAQQVRDSLQQARDQLQKDKDQLQKDKDQLQQDKDRIIKEKNDEIADIRAGLAACKEELAACQEELDKCKDEREVLLERLGKLDIIKKKHRLVNPPDGSARSSISDDNQDDSYLSGIQSSPEDSITNPTFVSASNIPMGNLLTDARYRLPYSDVLRLGQSSNLDAPSMSILSEDGDRITSPADSIDLGDGPDGGDRHYHRGFRSRSPSPSPSRVPSRSRVPSPSRSRVLSRGHSLSPDPGPGRGRDTSTVVVAGRGRGRSHSHSIRDRNKVGGVTSTYAEFEQEDVVDSSELWKEFGDQCGPGIDGSVQVVLDVKTMRKLQRSYKYLLTRFGFLSIIRRTLLNLFYYRYPRMYSSVISAKKDPTRDYVVELTELLMNYYDLALLARKSAQEVMGKLHGDVLQSKTSQESCDRGVVLMLDHNCNVKKDICSNLHFLATNNFRVAQSLDQQVLNISTLHEDNVRLSMNISEKHQKSSFLISKKMEIALFRIYEYIGTYIRRNLVNNARAVERILNSLSDLDRGEVLFAGSKCNNRFAEQVEVIRQKCIRDVDELRESIKGHLDIYADVPLDKFRFAIGPEPEKHKKFDFYEGHEVYEGPPLDPNYHKSIIGPDPSLPHYQQTDVVSSSLIPTTVLSQGQSNSPSSILYATAVTSTPQPFDSALFNKPTSTSASSLGLPSPTTTSYYSTLTPPTIDLSHYARQQPILKQQLLPSQLGGNILTSPGHFAQAPWTQEMFQYKSEHGTRTPNTIISPKVSTPSSERSRKSRVKTTTTTTTFPVFMETVTPKLIEYSGPHELKRDREHHQTTSELTTGAGDGTGAVAGAGTGAVAGVAGAGAGTGVAGAGAGTGVAGVGAGTGVAGVGAGTGVAGVGDDDISTGSKKDLHEQKVRLEQKQKMLQEHSIKLYQQKPPSSTPKETVPEQ